MIPYTYLVGWSQHDLWYYGVRYAKNCTPDDLWVTYFTSSKQVASTRIELGEPDIVEVRKTFRMPESAKFWEERVIRRMGAVKSSAWLNQCNQNVEFCRHGPLSEHVKEKMRRAKRAPFSEEHRAAISAAAKKRRPISEADREKMRLAAKVRWEDPDERMKASLRRSGATWSDEGKAKLSKTLTGRITSEETKSKMRATWAAKRLHKEEA